MIEDIRCEDTRLFVECNPEATRWLIEDNNWPRDAAKFEEAFEEAYVGTYSDIEYYIDELIDDVHGVSLTDWPFMHIDYEAAWQDLRHDNYWAYKEECGSVHIFRSN